MAAKSLALKLSIMVSAGLICLVPACWTFIQVSFHLIVSSFCCCLKSWSLMKKMMMKNNRRHL